MQNKQETITLRVNGQKTKVGVQPLRVVVLPDKRDEKVVSSEQKGSCDGRDADGG
jgi:hypothetical protein